MMLRYAVIYETGPGGIYSAYAPDLPGCTATGKTLSETKKRMARAIAFHIRGLKRHGMAVPAPTTLADTVEVGDAP
jgi:predicted RNase H-like HicB family nuclease